MRSTSQSLERIIIPDTTAEDEDDAVPTWSWASVKGAVGHVALNTEYAITKDLSYSWQGGDEKREGGGLWRLRGSVYVLSAECAIETEFSTIRPPQLLKYTSAVNEIKLRGEYSGWVLLDQVESVGVDMKDLLWVICVVVSTYVSHPTSHSQTFSPANMEY